MSGFHPELQRAARSIPRFSFNPMLAGLAQAVQKWRGAPKPPRVDGVDIRDVYVARGEAEPAMRIRLYSPQGKSGPCPGMLWIHGGGFVIGTPEQDEANSIDTCRRLGVVIAAAAYRLAPRHPYPAPMDDVYRALIWLHAQAGALGVARDRIAIGGNSAGAGLAAGLVLKAHDLGEVPVAFQLLVYPMLDDRTALRTDIDQASLRLWTSKSNRFGWRSYLGREPGGEGVADYAAPARRQDLGGLPPAWIGVGTCDLFHDEDVLYARRLNEAGAPCELKIVDGAFHGFEIAGGDLEVVRDFRRSYLQALSDALACGPI